MIQKHNHIRCKAIRDAANGESCVVCGDNSGTIVFAHLNEQWAGKGMGIKTDDIAGLFLCVVCHADYDSGVDGLSDKVIARGMYRTWKRLWERGIIGEIK